MTGNCPSIRSVRSSFKAEENVSLIGFVLIFYFVTFIDYIGQVSSRMIALIILLDLDIFAHDMNFALKSIRLQEIIF